MKILCWNIEHLNVRKLTKSTGSICSVLAQHHIIFILENKTYGNIISERLRRYLNTYTSSTWSTACVDAGGTKSTAENIIYLFRNEITASMVSDLTRVSYFSNAPFHATYGPTGVSSTFRIPAIVNLTWTDPTSGRQKNINLAIYHGPGPRSGTGNPQTAFNQCLQVLAKQNPIDLFIGDFNLYDTTAPQVPNYDPTNPPPMPRNGYIWVGDRGGTTLIRVGGAITNALSNSPLDRIYVYKGCNYTVQPDYLRTLGTTKLVSDHIPIVATINSGLSSLITPTPFVDLILKQPHLIIEAAEVAIDLQTLSQRLQQQVTAAGSFILNDATLNTQGLADLIAQSPLKATQIAVQCQATIPTPSPQDTTLTVQGTCSFLNVENLPTTVKFWINDGGAFFTLTAQLPQQWIWPNSFSELAHSDYFAQFQCSASPVFIFTTQPENDPSLSDDLQRGLNFSGQIVLPPSSLYGEVFTVLGGTLPTTAITVQGPIMMTQSASSVSQTFLFINLAAELPQLTLPLLKIPLSSYINTQYDGSSVDAGPFKTSLYLGGTLQINGKPLDISAQLIDSQQIILTFGDTTHPLASLDDIVTFFAGDTSWQSALPPEVLQLGGFALQSVAIALDFSTPIPTLPYLEVQVGTVNPWQILQISDTPSVTLQKLASVWQVAYPLDSVQRSLNVSLFAELTAGKNNDWVFELGLDYPEWLAYGSLQVPSSSLSFTLSRLLNDLLNATISIPDDLATLELDRVEVQVDTQAKLYSCTVNGALSLLGIKFQGLAVQLAYDGQKQQLTQAQLTGLVEISSILFTVQGSLVNDAFLQIIWTQQTNEALSLSDIFSDLGISLAIPSNLSFPLTQASFKYDFKNKILALSLSTPWGNALWLRASADSSSTPYSILEVTLPLANDLSSFPVLGQLHLPIETVQLLVASSAISQEEITRLLAFSSDLSLPNMTTIPAGAQLIFNFTNSFQLAPFTLVLDSPQPPSANRINRMRMPLALNAPSSPATQGSAQWITIGRGIGPLLVNRLGFSCQNSTLALLLDATIQLGGLTLQLQGLGVSFSLTDLTHPMGVYLDGLGLKLQAGSLQLSGDFYKATPGPGEVIRYEGEVVLQMDIFSVGAIGAYAEIQIPSSSDTFKSLFVYCRVTGDFGGPPYFLVTGFAGGFGYNQQLVLPNQDTAVSFPLVQGVDDPTAVGGKGTDLMQVLQILEGEGGKPAWVLPLLGEDWLGVGISFTTCELIFSKALVVAEFGKSFQLALIGRSQMTLPQTGSALAYVEMGLQAILDPAAGYFGMTAVISPNSYVLAPACHLTGGFALYVWFSGAHAGDFVVTLGGYHPSFVAPSWYPQEQPVGFNWMVGNTVTLHGSAYFALTPACAMAGNSLDILFHSGDLQAWLTAHTDFLLEWHPFHFDANVGVDVGVSYVLHTPFTSMNLKVELGAQVHVWAPEMGGTAQIKWWVISFTVSFGAPLSPPPTIDWDDFQKLLPHSQSATQMVTDDPSTTLSVLQIVLEDGLLKTATNTSNTGDSTAWMVRPSAFQFRVESVFPSTTISLNGTTVCDENGQATSDPINIKPMRKTGVTSTQTIQIQPTNTQSGTATWLSQVTKRNLPTALWGDPNVDPTTVLSGNATLPDRWVGAVIQMPDPTLGSTPGPVSIAQAFSTMPVAQGSLPYGTSPAEKMNIQADPSSITTISTGIASSPVQQSRNQLTSYLQRNGLFAQRTLDNVANLAAQAGQYFSKQPLTVNQASSLNSARSVRK